MNKGFQNHQLNYQSYLISEYESRKMRNSNYSLRAYARDIGVAGPKLSEILRGKCGLSEASARRIAVKIGLAEVETQTFVDLVNSRHARSAVLKTKAQENLKENKFHASYSELSIETFKIIADWFHFAILELTEVEDFISNTHWIAGRLNISPETAQAAVERLSDFGLLDIRNKKWKQTHKALSTPSGIPSSEIKKHHRQILNKAEESLTHDAVSSRDFSNMTLAIPFEAYAEVQSEIKKFRRELTKKYSESINKDRVYSLAIQFFPLDKKVKDIL